jgi:aryl-alcohol dehydrogenase-like predicted oxidoreductase
MENMGFAKGTCIKTERFGGTGHWSTRAIFGSAGLGRVSQEDADRALGVLLQYGVNHIDTAPGYGEAELRIGPWMREHRDHFFLATKCDQRRYGEAREQFYRSLERLQVDHVDLLQFHNLTDNPAREIIMGPGGALEFLAEARKSGLARFIGITGHGLQAPRMHLQTLDRFGFDTVLLPCNYLLMQNHVYADDFRRLLSFCRERSIAVQTIKSIARGFWGAKPRSRATWYEPLTDVQAIAKSVHWVLGLPDVFLVTAGDVGILPDVLKAAAAFESPPPDEEVETLIDEMGMEPIFT